MPAKLVTVQGASDARRARSSGQKHCFCRIRSRPSPPDQKQRHKASVFDLLCPGFETPVIMLVRPIRRERIRTAEGWPGSANYMDIVCSPSPPAIIYLNKSIILFNQAGQLLLYSIFLPHKLFLWDYLLVPDQECNEQILATFRLNTE